MFSEAILAGGRATRFDVPVGVRQVADSVPTVPSVTDGSHPAQDADIVVPKTERGYHPLCAVCTSARLEPAARRLADGRLTGLFDDVRVRVVTGESITMSGDPDRLLANVNTSIEYKAIEANGMQS
jgi:molybdopterin-guanine dinucleotide biosynthesis protein A